MKAKEDISFKCALGGGLAGLVIGLLDAALSVSRNGAGFISLMEIALHLMLWVIVLGLSCGAFTYGLLWWMERKTGGPTVAADDPAALQARVSYLRALNSETEASYTAIVNYVATAGKHLDAAEKEFEAGAFAPFWDEVEHAANDLAAYKNNVEYMRRNVDVYQGEALELGKHSLPAPPLELAHRPLPDARPEAARFMSIVRKAQTNFQFAVIFEQRKTNHLLHAGFGNLGAAIYSLGESISSSLDTLSRSLDNKAGKLISSKAEQQECMNNLYNRREANNAALDRIHGKNPLP